MYKLSADTIDLMPLNAWRIHSLNESVVFVVSLLANSLLICVLLQERNKTLRAYSTVLTLNCCVDLLFTFTAFVVNWECEIYDGLLIALLRGALLQNLSMFWHHLGFGAYIFTIYFSMFIIPIVFYFRYNLVVKDRQLSVRELLNATLIPAGAALTLGAIQVLANVTDDGSIKCEEALSHPTWTVDGMGVEKCAVAKGKFFALFVFAIASMDATMYTMMVYFTVGILKALGEARKHFSASTARLHRQMNILLTTQLLMPVMTAGIPVGMFVGCSFFHLTIIGTGMISTFLLAWLPLVNPLITILLVTNYRRRALYILSRPLALLGFAEQKPFSAIVPTSSSSVIDNTKQIALIA